MPRLFALLTLSAALAACGSDKSANTPAGDGMGGVGNGGGTAGAAALGTVTGTVPTTSGDVVRFLIMGDTGSGSDGQMAVGAAMADVCAEQGRPLVAATATRFEAIRAGCQFVLGFGDNIYEEGSRSATDPTFFDRFERAYLTFPADTPFYMVGGNHDNTGFVGGDGASNARGENQVAYTYQPVDSTGRDATNPRKTPRWRMPARFYDFVAGGTSDKPLLHFFAIDSNQLAGGFADASPDYSASTFGLRQLNWLKTGLRNSPASFKIAFAHHPYLSNGEHGNAGNYDNLVPGTLPGGGSLQAAVVPVLAGQRYKDFLEEAMCDVADVYMNGHDHDLQWLTAVPACGRTEFVVSGAGGKTRAAGDMARNLARIQRYDVYGFYAVEVRRDAQGVPMMRADLYTVTPGAGSRTVSVPRIDGSPDKTVSYAIEPQRDTRRDAGLAAYLTARGDSDALTLRQKPRTWTSSPTAFSASAQGSQCTAASAAPSRSATSSMTVSPAVGPLDPVQNTLSRSAGSLTAQAGSAAPISNALLSAVISVLDVSDVVLKAAMDSASQPQSAATLQQAAARDLMARLVDLGTQLQAGIPADETALSGAVSQYRTQMSAAASSDACTSNDLGGLVAPLVQLSRNLANIADAPRRQTEGVPVIAGLTRLLANALTDTSVLLTSLGTARTSPANDALLGTVDRLLKNLVSGVIPLDQAPADVRDPALQAAGALPAALLTVTREVTFTLDRTLLPATAPLTGLVRGLLAMLGLAP